jgi:hypothetical protein
MTNYVRTRTLTRTVYVGCARRDEKLDPARHILPVILAVSFLSVSQKIFNEIYSDIACPRPFLRGSNDMT